MPEPDADPAEAAEQNAYVGVITISHMAIMLAGLYALRVVAVLIWKHLKLTREMPLPDFLTIPYFEIMLLNTLALPASIFAMILLLQPQSTPQRVLGAFLVVFLVLFLGIVTTLLLCTYRNREYLGVEYIRLVGKTVADTGVCKQATEGMDIAQVLPADMRPPNGVWNRLTCKADADDRLVEVERKSE